MKIIFKYDGKNYSLPEEAFTNRCENIILPNGITLEVECWSMGFRPQPEVYLVHHATGNAVEAAEV